MAITALRRWRNGEVFTARDYMYEREEIVAEVNRLAGLLTGSSDLSVNSLTTNSITMGGETITSFDDAGTKIHYETLPNNAKVNSLFIDYD